MKTRTFLFIIICLALGIGFACLPEVPLLQDIDKEQTALAQGVPATQCRGITKDSTRCQRRTTDSTGYCFQHRNQYDRGPLPANSHMVILPATTDSSASN